MSAFDYAQLERWVRTDGLDAVTVDVTGVVFTTFDTDPAVAAGCVVHEASWDEVADGAPHVMPVLWRAAADRLRAVRVPGTTSCLVVRVVLGVRGDVDPYAWILDGAPLRGPHYEGPSYAGMPYRLPEDRALVIALAPGVHRLAGSARVYDPGPRELAFALDATLAENEDVRMTLARDATGALVARRDA